MCVKESATDSKLNHARITTDMTSVKNVVPHVVCLFFMMDYDVHVVLQN